MRRIFYISLSVFLAVSLAGCDTVQRKFTRKQKTVKAPRIYQLKKYDMKPSIELYNKHFAYWQSWQSEMIQRLGSNHKKDVRCVEEILGQLGDMQGLLVRQKADELDTHIARMERVKEIIVTEELTQANRDYVRRTVEREDRTIKRDFCEAKVRNYIKKSFDEEPQAEEGAAPAQIK